MFKNPCIRPGGARRGRDMRHFPAIAILVFSQLAIPALGAEEPKSSHKKVASPGGYIAHSFLTTNADGEPEGRVLIEKDGRVIATIKGVFADSFSPKADILLVKEAIADDDLRHYFLNIGEGEFKKEGDRASYVFGSRYATKSAWSDDGKYVVLFDFPGITEDPPAVIKVSDFVNVGSG